MRGIYSLVFVALCVFVKAQGEANFSFLGNGFDANWKPHSLKVISSATANSNGVNTGMYNDFLFREGFRKEMTDAFKANKSEQLNFYSRAEINFEYKLSKKWGVALNYQNEAAYTSSKQLFDMLLFGNADYQGTNITSDKLSFLRYTKAGFDATYLLSSSEKVVSKLSAGFFGLYNYSQAGSGSLSIFTAPRGEYIDISSSNFFLADRSNDLLQGLGLNLGYDVNYTWNRNNTLSFAAQDVNVTRMFNHSRVYLDTSFRFSGLQYDVFGDTTSLESYVDSNYLSVIRNGRKDIGWITLPSRINLQWTNKLNCRTNLIVGLEAIDLGRFGVSGWFGLDHEFSDKFRLLSTLGYGNFSGVVWSEAAEYRFNRVSLYTRLQSLHSLIIPENTTNYGASIGISSNF